MPHRTVQLLRWMATEARRLKSPARLIDVLGSQMILSGVPLSRVTWAMQPPAGDEFGNGLFWKPGHPVDDRQFDYSELLADRFQQSPFRVLLFGGQPIRRRLLDPDLELDFPILEELQKAGVTDYVALPVPLRDGRIHATTWATQADFGFEPGHIDCIEAVNDQLALLFELWECLDTAS